MKGHKYQWLACGLWPENRTFLDVDSIVVSWRIVAFFTQCLVAHIHLNKGDLPWGKYGNLNSKAYSCHYFCKLMLCPNMTVTDEITAVDMSYSKCMLCTGCRDGLGCMSCLQVMFREIVCTLHSNFIDIRITPLWNVSNGLCCILPAVPLSRCLHWWVCSLLFLKGTDAQSP